MNILMVAEKAEGKGGIETFAERHAARLRAEGHGVSLVAVADAEAIARCDEIVVHKCGDIGMLASFPPEKTVAYLHDHEAICPRRHAYTPSGHHCERPGAVWPCLFCAPVCRDWKGALGRVFAQARRKEILSRFKKLVVISRFMKGRMVANGLPAEKIEVVPPEIRLGPVSPLGRQVDLLFAGQLLKGKGLQILLRAMARLDASRTLDVVGAGNLEAELKSLAARLGLGERVRWHGFVENVQDWMAAARCVVAPSIWPEPYGLVAAEAVALGRRVVASDVGGLPEACGGKAVLVPPGDVAALARALEEPSANSCREKELPE